MKKEIEQTVKQIMTTPKPIKDVMFTVNSIQLCQQAELQQFNKELQFLMTKYKIIKILSAEFLRIPPQNDVAKG